MAQIFHDPREIPYLLVWVNDDGVAQEVVRVARYSEPRYSFDLDWTGWMAIKRPCGYYTLTRVVYRPMPGNRGRAPLLICSACQQPCRALYGWQPGGQYTTSVQQSRWQCRRCAGLRYSSEGGALVFPGRGKWARLLESQFGPVRNDRPELWTPYVFTHPADAERFGVRQGTASG